MQKKIYALITSMGVIASIISGCTLAGDIPANPETQYNSDFALPAHEYSYSLNREITAVCNVITSVMTQMHTVEMGEMPSDRALAAVEEAANTVQTSRDVVDRTMPAVNYAEARTKTLESMDLVLQIFSEYEEILQKTSNIEAKQIQESTGIPTEPDIQNEQQQADDISESEQNAETIKTLAQSQGYNMSNPKINLGNLPSRLKTEFNVLTMYQNIYFD